ncbi:hypothetical protein BC938DRAFT_478467, partial [Jimgerdemannia flammicorona]
MRNRTPEQGSNLPTPIRLTIHHTSLDPTEVNKVEKKPPEVVRLLVKRQILDSIDQYHEALPLLRGEMKETEEALVREKEVLKECDAIAEVLRAKLEELRQSSGQVQNTNL